MGSLDVMPLGASTLFLSIIQPFSFAFIFCFRLNVTRGAMNSIYLCKYCFTKNSNKICAKSKSKFTREQIDSMLSILSDMSNFDSHANEEQQEIITATKKYFQVMKNNKWWLETFVEIAKKKN